MSRVTLTGQGFIGSRLKKELYASLPLDFTHIPHDKIQDTTINSFDYFYFLSAYGNLASHIQDERIFKANLTDLLHVISQAVQFDFKSFVYLSTSSVKLRNQTMYSRSKKAAEEVLLAFMEKYNKPICIIRPMSITGVGEQEEHLIPTLIRAAHTGETINFVPWATHDFIDIEDVVAGILSLSNHSARGVYELGSGKSYSNNEVKKMVEWVTGKTIKTNEVESMRSYDNKEWQSTNFKARGFGWLPKKSLEESIKEMVKAYVTK